MCFQLQFSWTITGSGKQNDNEVETCIIHLMQMYIFVIEVAIAECRSQNIFTHQASLSLGCPIMQLQFYDFMMKLYDFESLKGLILRF